MIPNDYLIMKVRYMGIFQMDPSHEEHTEDETSGL